jgi:hypothetical protein
LVQFTALLLAILGCGAAFFLQLVLWRLVRPRRQGSLLVAVFIGTLIAELGILPQLGSSRYFVINRATYLDVSTIFIILLLCYLITYSAVSADSPTLVIIDRIHRSGEEGLPRQQIEEELTDAVLVMPRIEDLLKAKLVFMEGKKYCLTPRGKAFVSVFIFQRSILKQKRGG